MKLQAADGSRAAVILLGSTFRPDEKGVFDLVQPFAAEAMRAGLVEVPEAKAAPEPESPPVAAASDLKGEADEHRQD